MNFLRKNGYDLFAIVAMVLVVSTVLYNPAWLHWKSVWMTAGVLSAVAWAVVGRDIYLARKAKQAITGSYAHEIGAADRVNVHRAAVVEDREMVERQPKEKELDLRERMMDEDDDDGAAGPTPLGGGRR